VIVAIIETSQSKKAYRMFRLFLIATIAFGLLFSSLCAQSFTQRIESLHQTDGHLPGSYLQNQNAAGLVWYFSTIGLHAIALDGKHDQNVRNYLDLYLATANRPGGSINDVENLKAETIQWKLSDSDDSYSSGLLSLACWYSYRKGGEQWFQANVAQLKYLASVNLVDAIDSKLNLTCTFNRLPNRFTEKLVVGEWNSRHDEDLINKTNFRNVCQLMDNCESYRGLKDFANRLAELKDPEASKFVTAYQTLSQGIRGMFDSTNNSFRVNTVPSDRVAFYPNRLIQIAPEVFDVDLGPKTQEIYNHAWNYLNAGADKWWEGQIIDGSNQGDPMMILAYAAACHDDKKKALSHIKYFQTMLSLPSTSKTFSNIAELGWALRATRKLR